MFSPIPMSKLRRQAKGMFSMKPGKTLYQNQGVGQVFVLVGYDDNVAVFSVNPARFYTRTKVRAGFRIGWLGHVLPCSAWQPVGFSVG
jgi:hypothetical protein